VYTEPDWRGRGIANEIVRVLVDHFHEEPAGRCLLCSASAQSGRIYRKCGFEFIPPTAESGAMGLVKGESFAELEQRYFAPGRPVQVRAGHIGHRHDMDRLMDFSPAWIEARRRWHFAFVNSSVPTYMAALHQVEDGRGLLTVLQADAGSVVGYAYVLNLGSPWEANLRTLDFAVHPHYLAQAGMLLAETLAMAAQTDVAPAHAFVAACDERKLATLLEAEFTVAHRFSGAFALEGVPHDLLMLRR
jgi:L-amino acid N-acyltransferase YncA